MKTNRLLIYLIILAALIVPPKSAYAQTGEVKICLIYSDALTSTKRTLSGAKKTISRNNANATYYDILISKNPGENLILIDSIKKIDPNIILTVGSSATQLAKDNFANRPIVFSSVKYPVLSGFVNSINVPGENITGASIDIPVDVQFKKFKQIIPNLKKVGVLYSQNTEALIPQAKIIASQQGIQLVALKVNTEKELPSALDSLCKSVDGIWSVADHNLFKPKSTRYILLHTLKKRIPFMGFSRYVVESGALFALDFDYKAVGFQAGGIVNKIIAGKKPANIRVTTADVIWFHYNEKTSERINVKIPDELAAVAKEVYR